MPKEYKTEYDAKTVKELRKGVKDAESLVDALEKLGFKVPALGKAIRAVGAAVKIGTDIAEATDDAHKELLRVQDDSIKACKAKGEDPDICEYQVERLKQLRSLSFVLSPNNKNSTIIKSIDKILADYFPDICKQFQRCTKELEKQEKEARAGN